MVDQLADKHLGDGTQQGLWSSARVRRAAARVAVTQSSGKATVFSPSERVMNHWQEDLMFGYQFLNGCNPVLIRRCTKLPKKLPVTTEMVECSLERQLTLQQEVEVGPGYWMTSATASSDG